MLRYVMGVSHGVWLAAVGAALWFHFSPNAAGLWGAATIQAIIFTMICVMAEG